MIISRTPFRISFFGGGTDYPAWYLDHGGAVLSATIDKYCYIMCRYLPPFFEHRYCVRYSKIEYCSQVEEIDHPAVRAVLGHLNVDRGVEINHDGDLPARSGMGSSSSFTVGLLHAVHAMLGHMPSKHDLAAEGIRIEQEILRETVGSQDQVSVAYGGVNHISFMPNGAINVRPLTVAPGRLAALNAHLMLFYTGIKRTSSDVAGTYVPNLQEKRRQLRILMDLVDESIRILSSQQDLCAFGELLDEAWQAKRSLSGSVSNAEVDEIYRQARAAGAVGGKLTGAGGGGFMLLFVPPERQPAVLKLLEHLIHVPFEFEYSGSQIIFFDPEKDYSLADKLRQAQVVKTFRERTEIP